MRRSPPLDGQCSYGAIRAHAAHPVWPRQRGWGARLLLLLGLIGLAAWLSPGLCLASAATGAVVLPEPSLASPGAAGASATDALLDGDQEPGACPADLSLSGFTSEPLNPAAAQGPQPRRLWAQRRLQRAGGQHAAAKQSLQALLRWAQQAPPTATAAQLQATTWAQALAREARQALVRDAASEAGLLGRTAVAMAPHAASGHLALADVAWVRGELGKWLRHQWAGRQAQWATADGGPRLWVTVLCAWLGAALLTLALVLWGLVFHRGLQHSAPAWETVQRWLGRLSSIGRAGIGLVCGALGASLMLGVGLWPKAVHSWLAPTLFTPMGGLLLALLLTAALVTDPRAWRWLAGLLLGAAAVPWLCLGIGAQTQRYWDAVATAGMLTGGRGAGDLGDPSLSAAGAGGMFTVDALSSGVAQGLWGQLAGAWAAPVYAGVAAALALGLGLLARHRETEQRRRPAWDRDTPLLEPATTHAPARRPQLATYGWLGFGGYLCPGLLHILGGAHGLGVIYLAVFVFSVLLGLMGLGWGPPLLAGVPFWGGLVAVLAGCVAVGLVALSAWHAHYRARAQAQAYAEAAGRRSTLAGLQDPGDASLAPGSSGRRAPLAASAAASATPLVSADTVQLPPRHAPAWQGNLLGAGAGLVLLAAIHVWGAPPTPVPLVYQPLQQALSRAYAPQLQRSLQLYRAETGHWPSNFDQLIYAGILDPAQARFPWRQPYAYCRRAGGYALRRPLM